MKVRLTSIGLLFALMSAFVLVPTGSALAKNDNGKRPHPFKGVKAKGKFGDATVNVTEFAVNAEGKLVANGTVTSATRGTLGTFRDALVTVKPAGAVRAQQASGTLGTLQQVPCTILTLTLAPINLNLLGLVVQTTTINLVITGEEGLLGNLLCGIAGLLDNPSALAQLLNQILGLLGGSLRGGSPLTGALPITITRFANQNGQLVARYVVNGANGRQIGPFVTPAQVITPPEGTCEVLTLTLGPLDLNLLGLRVRLFGETEADPVTILIYAVPGPGNLLGNLLCGLSGLLDGPPTPARQNRIVRLLNRILAVAG
ncbi:MAG: hypothetical protein M3328_04955 [Chloroflexota bacterium]|nr:hypothetical protein [Chloroflexota bacterium]